VPFNSYGNHIKYGANVMLHDMSRRRFVTAAIGGVAALAVPSLAFGCKPKTLTLKSRYTGERVFDGARRVTLSVTWREAHNGEGLLILDPNISDDFRSTCIAIDEVPVEIKHLYDTQPLRNAKRYYELKERGADRKLKAGGRCWQLDQLLEANPTYVLKSIDKGGNVTATIELFK
jgi:hypothetical protein